MLVLAVLVSCKKKTEPIEPMDVGKDYYPLTLGKYVVYDVDSIIYDEFTFDSTHYKYRIKEKIEEEFTDSENKTAYKSVSYTHLLQNTSKVSWYKLTSMNLAAYSLASLLNTSTAILFLSSIAVI